MDIGQLIELEAIERLEARPGFSQILHPHMPEVELTSNRTGRGQWSLFQYDDGTMGAPRVRRHRYAELVVEYEKVDDRWRIASRTVRPRREHRVEAPLPAVEHPQSLTGSWLPAVEAKTATQLVDLEAIKQLKARYFRYLDTKDWKAWRRLFTDDARFEVPSVTTDGMDADAFVESVASNMAATRTIHHGHAPDVVLTGTDTASGVWALNDYVEIVSPSAPALAGHGIRGFGHYEERYRRDGGTWKIAHLRLSYLRLDPLKRPPIPQDTIGRSVGAGWLADASLPDAERLSDLRAIKDLKARYFRLLDGKQWNEWRSLFSDDARCAVGDGPDQIVDQFIRSARERIANATTIHHGHMPEIRFTGTNSARGIWAMFDFAEWSEENTGYTGYGHCEEEYRRDHGVWRIATMRLRRLRVDPLPAGRPLEIT